MASLSTWFRPYAQSRSPRRTAPRKTRTGTRKTAPSEVKTRQGKRALSSSAGVEATTYTCLPPREDFAYELDSSSLPMHQFAAEVKLSDAAKLHRRGADAKTLDGVVKEGGEDDWEARYGKFEIFEVDADEEEDEKEEKEFGKFQVYDLNGEEIEEEFEDDIEDSEQVNLGFEGETGIEFEGITYKEGDPEEIDVKEKGIPAVMRCFDRAKIFAKAGDGGNGVVAFRREKFVPLGGPSGGDGGRGGGVYVEVDGALNSLLPFRSSVHFRAGRGSHGQGKMMAGAKGEEVVIKVPPGTVVRESGGDGEPLLELLSHGQRALLLPGGRGGRGNASFKSGGNKVPRIAENGEEGPELWLELELKLVADVGIVGAPNAGKSTLLSAISAAQPAIANYPFTTLLPNLGVVSFDFDSTIVVADLPGLLEGAHRGFGLGHEFLRHTERCSSLIHVVDGSSQQPELEFEAVRLELEMFSPEIAEKDFIVAFNKMDLPEARENWPSFRKSLQDRGIEPFCMSAARRDGSREVILAAHKLLQERKASMEFNGSGQQVDLNRVADMVRKQRTASINDFVITRDSHTDIWQVEGAGLERFVQMTNWRYMDSERRFQHVLDACGVNRSLIKLGVKEGDTVVIGEMEMEWHDSVDSSGLTNMKRTSNSTKWAEWKS